jgi:hypothetical protein
MDVKSDDQPNIRKAVAALWKLPPPGPKNLFYAPEFVQLSAACEKLYPNATSVPKLPFALGNALRTLGLPCGLAPNDAQLAMSPDDAAFQLDAGFRQTQSTRVHLCPLDCAADLPPLSFGQNCIRRMSVTELETLVNPKRLRRTNSAWKFDAELFSEFTWLIVKEFVPLNSDPNARAVPVLFTPFDRDYGAIEPHPKLFVPSVETALFALLLAPWEDWVEYCDIDWRGFRVPWIYTVDDDLFRRPGLPPSPETLSWEPHFVTDQYGEEIEIEWPTRLPLRDNSIEASVWLNHKACSEVIRAQQSSLFETPIAHFLVSAFLSKGIDEFLAHITVIEAALGLHIDYKRPKLPNGKRPSATERVAIRLSTLLGDSATTAEFLRLYDARSKFLHGRTMSTISGQDRLLARRLARRVVVALIKVALAIPPPICREGYLNSLLVEAPTKASGLE